MCAGSWQQVELQPYPVPRTGSVIAAAAAVTGANVAMADAYEPRMVVYDRPTDWSGVHAASALATCGPASALIRVLGY